MSALFTVSGVLIGVASTSISMGGRGEIALLFVPALVALAAGAIVEYERR